MRRNRILTLGGVAVLAGAGIAVASVDLSPSAQAAAWAPTGLQLTVAQNAAHQFAVTSVPGPDGAPSDPKMYANLAVTAFPPNVQQVQFVEEQRSAAAPLTGASAPDDTTDVLVIRLTGNFAIETSVPKGGKAPGPGKYATLIVNASTGDLIDFGLEHTPLGQLPPQAATAYTASTASN